MFASLKRYHVNFFSLFHGDKLFLEFSGFEKRERFRKKSIEFPIKIYFVYQGLRLSKLNLFPISRITVSNENVIFSSIVNKTK